MHKLAEIHIVRSRQRETRPDDHIRLAAIGGDILIGRPGENAHPQHVRPMRPLRVEFSSPVPRRIAEKIMLVAPDGQHKPNVEQHRGETADALVEMHQSGFQKFIYFFGRNKGAVTGDASQEGVTAVLYEWNVATTKPWMNRLAPLLRPAFEWNHDWVMARGGEGISKLLGCRLLAAD